MSHHASFACLKMRLSTLWNFHSFSLNLNCLRKFWRSIENFVRTIKPRNVLLVKPALISVTAPQRFLDSCWNSIFSGKTFSKPINFLKTQFYHWTGFLLASHPLIVSPQYYHPNNFTLIFVSNKRFKLNFDPFFQQKYFEEHMTSQSCRLI